ncbi:MAG: T9SS type A sorting domain-containing protein [Flavobacteriales bacterium]|nr:T9SS type A sorting domain-containing protein [Flavobacteriales bacterium]
MNRIILLLSLFLPQLAFAQCYQLSPIPYSPYPYDQGIDIELTNDDMYSEVIEIGFSFCFFGDTVNRLVVSSNGYITFNDSVAGQGSPWSINDTMPYSSSPTFAILAPWQDINPGAGAAGIFYNTYGNAPFRTFVISYYEVAMFSCASLQFSNQIVLHESTNVIDINIKEKAICATWNGGAAVEGIVNQDGTEAFIVPGRNFPEQWEAYDDAYRFTPICSCPSVAQPAQFVLHGNVYEDLNGNCDYEANEPTIPNVRLNVLPNDIDVWTNFNGEYALLLDSGEYFITQSLLNPGFLNYTCTGSYIPFALSPNIPSAEVLFGNETTSTTDISISIGSTGLTPCQPSIQTIQVCNNGASAVFGLDITVNISNPLMEYNLDSLSGFSLINDSQLTMTIDTVPPFACLTYRLLGTVACDSSLQGNITCFTTQAEILNGEAQTENNSFQVCESVTLQIPTLDKRVQSISETNKWVLHQYIGADDELVYRIRYMNSGMASIENLTIVDTISPFLNHTYFEPIISSHDFNMNYNDGALTFNFFDINLPAQDSDFVGSQLYVTFRMYQTPGNPVGTIIENRADIYLELPYAQSTGTVQSEIRDFTGINELSTGSITVFPNPTTGEVFLSNSSPRNTINSVEIIDAQGRLLLKQTGSGISKVDLSQLSRGIYLLRIQTEKGTQVERIIRN